MSPRGKRLPPPKPIVRSGALGYAPLNALSASYLVAGYGDTVLGFRDPEFRAEKAPTLLQVKKDSHLRDLPLGDLPLGEVPLAGAAFNGYADALYRGRLPEVVLSFPAVAALPDFLAGFAEYLEQLLALGFLIPPDGVSRPPFGKEALRQADDPLAALVPCFVLAGSGLLFSRFITGLVHYLQDLKGRYAFSDEETLRTGLIARFVRALPDESALRGDRLPDEGSPGAGTVWEDADCQARPLDEVTGRPFPWREPVRRFRIAGGNQATQRRVQSVMAAHGLGVSVAAHAGNAVERLEFENAWRRLSTVVLPALARRDGWSKERLKQYVQRTRAGLVAIGRLRQAFGPVEDISAPMSGTSGKRPANPIRSPIAGVSSIAPDARICPEDRIILSDLDQYALMLGLNEERALFRELAGHL
jgi:hypothetical protein